MADPAHLLALSSPQSVNVDHIPTGPGAISWELVACVLSKMDELPARYCRVKYCEPERGERNGYYKLQRAFHEQVIYPRARNLNLPIETTELLSLLIIDECLSSGRCDRCGGNGHEVKTDPPRVDICPRCSGTGNRGYSDNFRRKAIGITSKKGYEEKWQGLHRRFSAVVWGWESELRHLLKWELLGE